MESVALRNVARARPRVPEGSAHPVVSELPDVARWDPTPEEQAELRERLLRAGEARGGAGG